MSYLALNLKIKKKILRICAVRQPQLAKKNKKIKNKFK